MLLPRLLILTLILCAHILHSAAKVCPKGHRKVPNSGGCEVCPDGYYQPEENDTNKCEPCTNCEADRGSSVKQECSKETDRKCKCREGFVTWDNNDSTCKCNPGSGLKNGECLKCEHGYFNNHVNSPCQKWKECKSGVNISGTSTSDVICNDLKSDLDLTTNFITQLTSHRPRDETQTQTTSTVATTTAPLQPNVNKNGKEGLPSLPNTGNYIGMTLLLFGITGLLILTAVTCKLHITPCVQRKTAVQTTDSCRRPVEESGGILSSLKLNPEEP